MGMFDIFHLPELNDKYFKSLFFVLCLLMSFFGADYWLLCRYPNINRKELKLFDFFISRLRLLVPVLFVLALAYGVIYKTFERAMPLAMMFTAVCFYGSALMVKRKLAKPYLRMEFWLLFLIAACPTVELMNYNFIIASLFLFIYMFALAWYFFRKNNNKNAKL